MKKMNALLNSLDTNFPNPYPRMTMKDMMMPNIRNPKGKGKGRNKGKKHWENYYMGLYDSIESGYNSIVASRKIGSGRKNKKPLKEPLESEYSEEAS
jgi:hypothetical protein